MNVVAPYTQDIFLLILGISMVIDLIVLVGTVRAFRIRRVRMLTGIVLISIFLMAYMAFTWLILLGYVNIPGAYPGILLAFATLVVIYLMILNGMH
ncbi:MAG: hypothetical protein M1151_00030 [Candidatus Thermoplasmatota archaeon]|jgi:hypothetical protein|nr:hypothetical protein [Candidatus Thermoplasmatota archaeon]MCL5785044.1 hypothetical protein [Candidatus Thermoplasmatota archaeon]